MIRSRIYTPAPLKRQHWLAVGLQAWHIALPWRMAGGTWYDLAKVSKGTLTTMGNANNGWRSTTRQGGFGAVLFDGSAGYVTVSPIVDLYSLVYSTTAFWVK